MQTVLHPHLVFNGCLNECFVCLNAFINEWLEPFKLTRFSRLNMILMIRCSACRSCLHTFRHKNPRLTTSQANNYSRSFDNRQNTIVNITSHSREHWTLHVSTILQGLGENISHPKLFLWYKKFVARVTLWHERFVRNFSWDILYE